MNVFLGKFNFCQIITTLNALYHSSNFCVEFEIYRKFISQK